MSQPSKLLSLSYHRIPKALSKAEKKREGAID
jgi:hypothetical protein